MDAFWDWFASIADALGKGGADGLLTELDARILALGDFAWEVGPGEGAARALVISPGGNRARLAQTRTIIERAPKIPGWEFLPAKPPKQWRPVFCMEVEAGRVLDIDASGWSYVLLRYPDGATELLVEAPNTDGLSEGDRRCAAEIALDGILGEEVRLEFVEELDVCTTLENRFAKSARPLATLVEAIRS